MNSNIIKDINKIYDVLEFVEESKNKEVTIKLLNGWAVLYYSNFLNIFKVDITDEYVKDDYAIILSKLSKKDFIYYVDILTNSYQLNTIVKELY